MRSLKLFLIFALLAWSSVIAGNANGVSVSPKTEDGLYPVNAASLLSGGATERLDSFVVTASDPAAGDTTQYELCFGLSRRAFRSLERGGFLFLFPDGFDLSLIEVVEVADDYPLYDYRVKKFEVSDALLTIHLTKRRRHGAPWSGAGALCPVVRVTVLVRLIGNPTASGQYLLTGVAFDRHDKVVAGPDFCEPFSIIPGPLYAIDVSPADEITVRAGDVITFSAVGVDQFGNVITSLEFEWFLADGSDSIGEFSGSLFQALTVGQGWAVASTDGVQGQSGRITVIPGELAEMELKISPDQVVGQPFLQLAEIALYDAYGNLKTDYNLPEKPISLAPDGGSLAPDVIDDQQLLSEGVVNLLPAEITYAGPSAVVRIHATNGEVTSGAVEVAFNGYDILAVLDGQGAPLSRVFEDAESPASVVVQNNGGMKASSPPVVRACFESANDSTEATFEPNSDGVIDTVRIVLPPAPQAISEGILVIELIAEYNIGGQIYTTTNRWELSVEIVAPYSFEIVEGSFRPDTAYPGKPFEISFDVAAGGFTGPIDRTHLIVTLVLSGSRTPIIYRGSPRYALFENGVISYSGLSALVELHHNLQPGWYVVQLDYGLLSDGVRFGLTSPFVDSMYLLPELQVSYVSNSLEPVTVFAGAEVTFRFDLNLGNDFLVGIVPDDSRFTITGSGFSASTNLILPGDSLYPGETAIETEMMFVPLSQLGESLHVSASLPLIIPGVGGTVAFETDFEGQSISVDVESVVADLLVEPLLIGSNLVLPGREKELFRLNLTNREPSPAVGIRVVEIGITFWDHDNSAIDVGSILDPSVSGFYEDGLPVSHSLPSGNKLLLLFDDFVVPPAQADSIVFVAKFRETVPPSFRLDLERHHISAVFAEGPNAGQPVEITSTVDGERLISQVYVTKGKTLQESFVIENNPFNPEVSEARFSYELEEPSAVEFRVFTLTGEEVYARDLPKGSNGTAVGENEIAWHGRNNRGHMVRNGVYIVSIKIVRTGQYARMKVAVVK